MIVLLPTRLFFAVLFVTLLGLAFGAVYEPGTPGAVWSATEIQVVREKIIHMLDGSQYQTGLPFMQKVKTGPRKGQRLFTKNDVTWINRPMPSRVIRLAFHDCVSSWSGVTAGEGDEFGCDGCLYWDDEEMSFLYREGIDDEVDDRTVKKDSFYYEIPKAGTNNGLKTIVKALEYVYDDPTWPPGAQQLEASLKDSGKSRADLWQFAANVALELEIERANFACKYDITNQQSAILEGGEDACLIKLPRPIPFKFGRKDCISDGGHSEDQTATYKTTNPETPFDHNGPSKDILDEMERTFTLSKEESIALMAVHSTAPNKPNERENIKYGWIGNYLSNMYYKYLAMVPTYMVELGMNSIVPDNFVLRGDQDGNPVDGRRWTIHCFNQWKKQNGNEKFTGPFIFKPTFVGCRRRVDGCDEEKCEQCFYTPNASPKKRITKEDVCPIGFIDNVPQVVANDGTLCTASSHFNGSFVLMNGPEYKATRKSQKAISKGIPVDIKECAGSTCDKLPIFVLTYEMNFVYDFELDSNHRPMMGDSADEGLAKNEKSLIASSFPRNQDSYEIIENFANNQQTWSHRFFDGWEKIQNHVVGYDLEHDSSKTSWIGHSFMPNQANLDTLPYPLLFTDNDKANPRFFARTRLQGARRLSFTTLREICKNTKIDEEQWIKNDLGEQYNPCPTELMKEYTCPIDGCSEDKCAIHWTLCN